MDIQVGVINDCIELTISHLFNILILHLYSVRVATPNQYTGIGVLPVCFVLILLLYVLLDKSVNSSQSSHHHHHR